MNVVIVGMMKSQIQHVAPDFPALRIASINREVDGQEDDQVLARADRILLMTKFVSHSLIKKLDKNKITYINGGLTRLRSVLKTIDAADAIQTPRSPVTINEQYEDVEMKAKYDLTPMRHAKVGDVLTFKRAPEHSRDKFVGSIQVGRSYYKINYGVITEMVVHNDEIEVMVTAVKDMTKKPAPEPVKEVQQLPAPVPAPVAAPEKLVLDHSAERDRQFWMDVYLQAMRVSPGSPGSWHADANDAIDKLRSKLG